MQANTTSVSEILPGSIDAYVNTEELFNALPKGVGFLWVLRFLLTHNIARQGGWDYKNIQSLKLTVYEKQNKQRTIVRSFQCGALDPKYIKVLMI